MTRARAGLFLGIGATLHKATADMPDHGEPGLWSVLPHQNRGSTVTQCHHCKRPGGDNLKGPTCPWA